MKKLRPALSRLKAVTFELPFFIFLTLVLILLFTWAVIDSPDLRQPERLAPFAVLMLAHILLYWAALLLPDQLRWKLGYLLLQGALVFTINMATQTQSLVLGLYLGLIGIATGMLGLTRWGIAAIAFYLTLVVVNFGQIVGWQNLSWWMLIGIPMAIFVILYVTLYLRQAEARTRAQSLLKELEAANSQLIEYAPA